MDTDICICTKTQAEHERPLTTGACLEFRLDRKATWNADRDRTRITRQLIRAGMLPRFTLGGRLGFSVFEALIWTAILLIGASVGFAYLLDRQACAERGGMLVEAPWPETWACVARAKR